MQTEIQRVVITDAQKIKNKSVWYKILCKDQQNRTYYYPAPSIIYQMIVTDLQERGPFQADLTLEHKSPNAPNHIALSKLVRSYDIINETESQQTTEFTETDKSAKAEDCFAGI